MRRFFILVEGADDVRFLDRIIKPLLEPRYTSVELMAFTSLRRGVVSRFLRSLERLCHDYVLTTDIDAEPSAKAKKRVIMEKFPDLDPKKVIIVIKEIEGRYMAEIDGDLQQAFGLPPFHSTDDLTKEAFNSLIPGQFTSRIESMVALLENFQISSARTQNRSCGFFAGVYQISEVPDRNDPRSFQAAMSHVRENCRCDPGCKRLSPSFTLHFSVSEHRGEPVGAPQGPNLGNVPIPRRPRGNRPKRIISSGPLIRTRRRVMMDKYICTICGHIYDPAVGEERQNINPGVAFEDLPNDWTCPVCGAGKALFRKV